MTGSIRARTPMLLLIALLACGPTNPPSNQAATNDLAATEWQVKAGFLYNFAVFTTWPSNVLSTATNSITIGVLGQDEFGEILSRVLAGKRIHERKVKFRRCANAADARACQVLYIGNPEAARLPEILRGLEHAAVLTVGEMPGFAERGGMIALTKTNDRVAFNVNLTGARQAGLTISSKLLRLAGKIVEPAKGQESR